MSHSSSDESFHLLQRGCEAIYTESDLRERLAQAIVARCHMRVKLGMDLDSKAVEAAGLLFI